MWPDSTDSWLYLTGACVTASIATFSSNAAVKYISPGLASIAQNTDIIGSSARNRVNIALPFGFCFTNWALSVSNMIDVLMLTQN